MAAFHIFESCLSIVVYCVFVSVRACREALLEAISVLPARTAPSNLVE